MMSITKKIMWAVGSMAIAIFVFLLRQDFVHGQSQERSTVHGSAGGSEKVTETPDETDDKKRLEEARKQKRLEELKRLDALREIGSGVENVVLSQANYIQKFSEAMAFAGERILRDAIASYRPPAASDVVNEFKQEVDAVEIINNNIRAFQSSHEQQKLIEYAEYYNNRNRLRNSRMILLDKIGKNAQRGVFKIEFDMAASMYKEKDLYAAKLYFEDIYESYQNIAVDEMSNVLFWSAESSFGLRFFSEARKKYDRIISTYPSSHWHQFAIYRVFLMRYVSEDVRGFIDDYDKISSRMFLASTWDGIVRNNKKANNERDSLSVAKKEAMVELDRLNLMLKNPRLRQNVIEKIQNEVLDYSRKVDSFESRIRRLTLEIDNRKGRVLDSIKHAVSSKSLDQNARVMMMLSIFYYKMGKFYNALDVLSKIPSFLVVSNMARYVEALCMIKMGNSSKAVSSLEDITKTGAISQKFSIDHDLIGRSVLQLSKGYYEQADNLMSKANDVYSYDATRQAVVDSIDDLGGKERDIVQQARNIEKQIVEDFVKTQRQRLEQDSLSEQIAKEAVLLTEVDEVVQRLAYKTLVSNDTSAKRLKSMVDFVLRETLETRAGVKEIAGDLDRLGDVSKRTQLNIADARRGLRERIAKIKYQLADRSFSLISEDHPDKPIAEIGRIWSLIKQRQYEEAIMKSRKFKENWRVSDKIYQAVLAEAYIVQKQYPSNIDELMKIYGFIWDGEATYLFVKKFIYYRIQILERKYYFEQLIRQLASKSDIEKIQFTIAKMDEILSLVFFRPDDLNKLDVGQLLSEHGRTRLQELIIDLEEMKAEWKSASKRLGSEARILEQVTQIIAALLEMGKSDYRDIKYFLAHAPAIYQAELNEYEKELDVYGKTTEKGVQDYQKMIEQFGINEKQLKNDQEKFLRCYMMDELYAAKNKNDAFNTLLKLREFQSSDGISRFAKEARYGFVASVYDYIRKLAGMIVQYRTKIENIKEAIKRKIDQLEINAGDIESYIVNKEKQEGPIKREAVGDREKEFSDIISNYDKSYFIGTQHLTVKNKGGELKKLVP